ncbi:2-hydroxyisoflavanone dehydratase-like [Vitis riparia]|uniref:2-hydroxyisoflavanone dehydratase-like n=1 Tax=Vitis riparia TaxID=96939 RepID=UPI00155A42F4|nr:2-hydroxyisoflavanone dehydratase-like [Vitis riparia]
MDSREPEIACEFLPFLRVYKDGSIDRLVDPPSVPPSLDDPDTGVSSKDIIISPDTGVSARIYLPKLTNTHQKLPILVYFHGGGFCVGSAFSAADHRYINTLSSQATLLAISIEYRLAPTHPLPTAYEDCWAALQWVSSHSTGGDEPWLTQHGNFDRIFIGGDSAGGNIAHNTVMRAGTESLPNGVRILGAFLSQPYFWGSQPIGSESVEDHHQKVSYRIWKFVCPSSEAGIDDSRVNPCSRTPGCPSLSKLGCRRLLVCVAGKDELRDRDVRYYEAVRESGWEGEVELYEEKEEDHVFHIFNPESENAKYMISRLVAFLQMK